MKFVFYALVVCFLSNFIISTTQRQETTIPDHLVRISRFCLLGLLKKGDLIRYGTSHISIMYSEKWGESMNGTDYDIIHAYGTSRADLDNNPATPMEFSRKVVISPNSMSTAGGEFPGPTGFGRLKLWQ